MDKKRCRTCKFWWRNLDLAGETCYTSAEFSCIKWEPSKEEEEKQCK